MASKPYEDKHRNDPPVKVTHRETGCPLDGKRGTHEHSQADWRELIDNTDPFASQR